MRIMTLDPKATHVNHPTCPSRLVPSPRGGSWMCLDCGFQILWKAVEIKEIPRTVQSRVPGWWEDEKGFWHPPEEMKDVVHDS